MDMVCAAAGDTVRPDCLYVGARNGIVMADFRAPTVVRIMDGLGGAATRTCLCVHACVFSHVCADVRSLSVWNTMLTVGSSAAGLSFIDTRMLQPLSLLRSPHHIYYATGKGWQVRWSVVWLRALTVCTHAAASRRGV